MADKNDKALLSLRQTKQKEYAHDEVTWAGREVLQSEKVKSEEGMGDHEVGEERGGIVQSQVA